MWRKVGGTKEEKNGYNESGRKKEIERKRENEKEMNAIYFTRPRSVGTVFCFGRDADE